MYSRNLKWKSDDRYDRTSNNYKLFKITYQIKHLKININPDYELYPYKLVEPNEQYESKPCLHKRTPTP